MSLMAKLPTATSLLEQSISRNSLPLQYRLAPSFGQRRSHTFQFRARQHQRLRTPPTVSYFTTEKLQCKNSSTMASATSFYDFKPLNKAGKEVPMSDYKGKVVLVVNTASKCGFTPQYEGLEKLWQDVGKAHPDDFVILGFPCNQFGHQEPGTDDEIQSFCQVNYGVTFPIMQKADVNGDDASPLFQWLKEEKPGVMGLKRVKWNFEKFLVGRDGKVKGRWASTTKPEQLEKPILDEIAGKV